MNLRDVPDDVYDALASAASAKRQSLNAYVIERLTEAARTSTIAEHFESWVPPQSRVSVEDIVTALHEERDARG